MTEPRITRKQAWIVIAIISFTASAMYAAWQQNLSDQRENIRMGYERLITEHVDRVEWLEEQLGVCLSASKLVDGGGQE